LTIGSFALLRNWERDVEFHMNERDRDVDKHTEVRHLLRHVTTTLELAIVGHAPSDIVNRLGRAAGLLDATIQLSIDAPPAKALMPDLIADAHAAIERWEVWQKERAASA
jgi:hypothetical protein